MSKQYLTVDQKLSKAIEEKEQGNIYFKKDELRKAKKRYHIALMYVKDVEKPNPLEKMAGISSKPIEADQLKEILSLRSVCYNNLSGINSIRVSNTVDDILTALKITFENPPIIKIKAVAHHGWATRKF